MNRFVAVSMEDGKVGQREVVLVLVLVVQYHYIDHAKAQPTGWTFTVLSFKQLPFHRRQTLVAIIANQATHDVTVFLFDEALIILLVGSAPGEGDLFLIAIGEEFVRDELGPVVGIESQDGEGKTLPHVAEGLDDEVLVLVEQRLALGPSRLDVREYQAVEERAGHARSAVSHRIGFEKTDTVVVPVGKGTDGNLVFEQRPWTCGAGRAHAPVAPLVEQTTTVAALMPRRRRRVSGSSAKCPKRSRASTNVGR